MSFDPTEFAQTRASAIPKASCGPNAHINVDGKHVQGGIVTRDSNGNLKCVKQSDFFYLVTPVAYAPHRGSAAASSIGEARLLRDGAQNVHDSYIDVCRK